MEQRNDIDTEIMDAIMERPYGFTIKRKRFYLYPITLGKSILLSRLIQALDIDRKIYDINPIYELYKAVEKSVTSACQIIAYATASGKKEVCDFPWIESRIKYFSKHLSKEEIVGLLLVIFQFDKYVFFMDKLGLLREQKEQAKISKLKNKDGNSVVFGGKSIYGTLIDAACNKYGWSFEYVVWGISFMNLRMLLADATNVVYLTDEEKKNAGLTVGQDIIDMDDPNNRIKVLSCNWD